MKVRKMSKQQQHNNVGCTTLLNTKQQQQQQQQYMYHGGHYQTSDTVYYHANLKPANTTQAQKHAQITIDYYHPTTATCFTTPQTTTNYIYNTPTTATNTTNNRTSSSNRHSSKHHQQQLITTAYETVAAAGQYNHVMAATTAATPVKNRIYVNDEMLKYQMSQHEVGYNYNNRYEFQTANARVAEKSGFEQLDELLNTVAKSAPPPKEATPNRGRDDAILPVLMPLPIPNLGIPRLYAPQQPPSYQTNVSGFASGIVKNTSPAVAIRPLATPDTKPSNLVQYEGNNAASSNLQRPNRSSSNNSRNTAANNNSTTNNLTNMINGNSSNNNADPNEELIYKLNKHIYNKQIARSEDNLKIEQGKRDRSQPTTTRVIKIEQGSPPPPPRLKIQVDSMAMAMMAAATTTTAAAATATSTVAASSSMSATACNLKPKSSSMPKDALLSHHHSHHESKKQQQQMQLNLNIAALDKQSKMNTCNSVTGHTISNDAQFASSPFKFPSPIEKLKSNSMTSVGIEPELHFKPEHSVKINTPVSVVTEGGSKNLNMSLENLSTTINVNINTSNLTANNNNKKEANNITTVTAENTSIMTSTLQQQNQQIYSPYRSISQQREVIQTSQKPNQQSNNSSMILNNSKVTSPVAMLPRPSSQTNMFSASSFGGSTPTVNHAGGSRDNLPANLQGKAHANVFANMNVSIQTMIQSIMQTNVKSNPKLINQAVQQSTTAVQTSFSTTTAANTGASSSASPSPKLFHQHHLPRTPTVCNVSTSTQFTPPSTPPPLSLPKSSSMTNNNHQKQAILNRSTSQVSRPPSSQGAGDHNKMLSHNNSLLSQTANETASIHNQSILSKPGVSTPPPPPIISSSSKLNASMSTPNSMIVQQQQQQQLNSSQVSANTNTNNNNNNNQSQPQQQQQQQKVLTAQVIMTTSSSNSNNNNNNNQTSTTTPNNNNNNTSAKEINSHANNNSTSNSNNNIAVVGVVNNNNNNNNTNNSNNNKIKAPLNNSNSFNNNTTSKFNSSSEPLLSTTTIQQQQQQQHQQQNSKSNNLVIESPQHQQQQANMIATLASKTTKLPVPKLAAAYENNNSSELFHPPPPSIDTNQYHNEINNNRISSVGSKPPLCEPPRSEENNNNSSNKMSVGVKSNDTLNRNTSESSAQLHESTSVRSIINEINKNLDSKKFTPASKGIYSEHFRERGNGLKEPPSNLIQQSNSDKTSKGDLTSSGNKIQDLKKELSKQFNKDQLIVNRESYDQNKMPKQQPPPQQQQHHYHQLQSQMSSKDLLDKEVREINSEMKRDASRERLVTAANKTELLLSRESSRDMSSKELNIDFSRELTRESSREILREMTKDLNKEAAAAVAKNREAKEMLRESASMSRESNREGVGAKYVGTPLLDALTNSIPKLQQSISSSSATPEVSPILSPALVNEFKTSLYVGADFTSDDITVQLIDNFSGFKVSKKLFVHCFRIEPISNKSVTLASGQIIPPTTIDLDLSNGTNYLRKELKKDIHIPNNADINTLESYLENGHLVIKCMLKKEGVGSAAVAVTNLEEENDRINGDEQAHQSHQQQRRSSPVYSSTPVYSKAKSSSSSKNGAILSEFEIKNSGTTAESHSKDLSPLEITINSRTSDSNDVSSNFVFENPLYNNSTIQANGGAVVEQQQQQQHSSGKSILKNANDPNILVDYTSADLDDAAEMANYMQQANVPLPPPPPQLLVANDQPQSNTARKNRKVKDVKSRRDANSAIIGTTIASAYYSTAKETPLMAKETEPMMNTRSRDKAKPRPGKSDKRHYKSNEALNERYRSDYDRKSNASNEHQNYDRTMSFIANPVSKSVRFDINESKSANRRSESHHSNKMGDNHHHQRHRSTSSKSRSAERCGVQQQTQSSSIPSSLGRRHSSQMMLSNSSGMGATSSSSSRMISSESIQDGFNCITKDALDNIYLTYFFKLPSCSPSDRTQVRIEDNNILKLKIIQEKNFAVKPKRRRSRSSMKATSSSSSPQKKHHHRHKHHRRRKYKNDANSGSSPNTANTSSSSSLSSSSVIYESLNEDSSSCSCSEDSDEEDNSEEDEDDDSVPCFNQAGGDKTKVVLREFSRRCRLPDNLFRFDETGVSVSFINNIWVRIEIPIIEFIDFSPNIITSQQMMSSSSSQHHHHSSHSSSFNLNSGAGCSSASKSGGGGVSAKKKSASSSGDKQSSSSHHKADGEFKDHRLLKKTSSNELFFFNEVKI